MIKHYLTSSEAAQYIEDTISQPVSYYDLDNLIRAEAITPPDLIAGRRLWSLNHLKEACKAMRVRRAKRPVLAEKRIRRGNMWD
ncbi:MAG: hypothetical protein WD267_05685 [Balneolales bacterium]